MTRSVVRQSLKFLKIRLEALAFILIASALSALPVEWASFLSGKAWRLMAPLLHRHRRAVSQIQSVFPDLSRAECARMACASWENLGRTFAESFHLATISTSNRITFENTPDLEAISAMPHRLVMCAPHLGNWEIGAIAAMQCNISPMGIYQRIKNPLIEKMVLAQRTRYFTGGLFSKQDLTKGLGTLRTIMHHVRAGGVLMIMADQRDLKGVHVPFLGQSAPSTPFPAYVARTQKARLYTCRAKRLKGVRFLARVDAVPFVESANQEADVLAMTAAIQANFETYIKDAKDQWMWAHRRWKK